MEIPNLKVVQVPNAGPAAAGQRERHISSQHQGTKGQIQHCKFLPNRLRWTMLADNDNKSTLTAHVEEKTKQAPFENLAIVWSGPWDQSFHFHKQSMRKRCIRNQTLHSICLWNLFCFLQWGKKLIPTGDDKMPFKLHTSFLTKITFQ